MPFDQVPPHLGIEAKEKITQVEKIKFSTLFFCL